MLDLCDILPPLMIRKLIPFVTPFLLGAIDLVLGFRIASERLQRLPMTLFLAAATFDIYVFSYTLSTGEKLSERPYYAANDEALLAGLLLISNFLLSLWAADHFHRIRPRLVERCILFFLASLAVLANGVIFM